MKNSKFILLLLSFSAFSQVKYGISAGLNLADVKQQAQFIYQYATENVSITDSGNSFNSSTTEYSTKTIDQTMDVKTSTKISFYIGGFAELPINTKKNLFLRAELLYAQNGANIDKTKEDDNYNSGDYTISYSTNGGKYTVEQLNMPVLLKYVTKEKIAILGGCYIGTILSAKAINNNGATNDFTQEMKKFDFGLALGISYQIKKKIAIALRYNRGLINLDPTEENNAYYQFKGHYYNRTIHIGLEYLLN